MAKLTKYNVRVTIYHAMEIEALNEEDCREQMCQLDWQEYVKDVIVDIEPEVDDGQMDLIENVRVQTEESTHE